MIERIVAMFADLTENGFRGAAALTITVAVALGILSFAIFCAMLSKNNSEEENKE